MIKEIRKGGEKMITLVDFRKEMKPLHMSYLEGNKAKLKYTKKTVKRNALKKDIMFWQAQVEDNESDHDIAMEKYFEKYPVF